MLTSNPQRHTSHLSHPRTRSPLHPLTPHPCSPCTFALSPCHSDPECSEGEESLRPLLALIDYLRAKNLLPLLDNCEHLVEAERRALCRLSVFAGGWTFEAAEVVVGQDGILPDDLLDVLAHLVDKSLVSVDEPGDDGATRYRFLETIRQYARDKLLERMRSNLTLE